MEMKKGRKQISMRMLLTTVVSLVMLLGLTIGMRLTAYADESTQVSNATQFITAVQSGRSVQLTADFTLPLDDDLIFGAAVTIDLNGHTITVQKNEDNCSWMVHAPMTIKDGSQAGGGKIINPANNYVFLIGEYADESTQSSSLTLESGTLEFTGENAGISAWRGPFTMTGGTINSVTTSICRHGSKVTISGGTIIGNVVQTEGDISITGGSFSFDPSTLLTEGYSAIKEGDYWVVRPVATVTTIPTAKTLTATGSAQELVTAGKADGGEIQYALGTDDKTTPTSGWSTSIPTGTDAKTYYVWYMAKGDENHNDSKANSVEVKISEAVIPNITLDATELSLKAGEDKAITATVVPEGENVTWTSDKEAVATVDSTGKVKAVSEGTAIITGKITVNGKDYSAECKVTVNKVEPEPAPKEAGIKLNVSELTIVQGRENALKATTVPEGASVTWTSSDNSIATVDASGVVKGLKPGTATITAKITVEGAEYTTNCKVTVISEGTPMPIPVPAGTPIIIPSIGGGEHTHKYVWDTIEASEDADGELRYQCETCGDIKERVSLTAYNVFNKNITEKIRKAPKDAAVKIETGKWISFHKMVMEALAERPDVTLEISFLDEGYKGNRCTVTIPKGTDTMSLVDKNGFTGFLYLGGKFGLKTN